jgi:hypothetical protein
VDVKPFHIWIFPQYEEFNQLIGSLADGPLWVLGPNGPVPVDPWGPKVATRAKEAYAEIRQGLGKLYALGDEVIALRARSEGVKFAEPLPSGARRRKKAARR